MSASARTYRMDHWVCAGGNLLRGGSTFYQADKRLIVEGFLLFEVETPRAVPFLCGPPLRSNSVVHTVFSSRGYYVFLFRKPGSSITISIWILRQFWRSLKKKDNSLWRDLSNKKIWFLWFQIEFEIDEFQLQKLFVFKSGIRIRCIVSSKRIPALQELLLSITLSDDAVELPLLLTGFVKQSFKRRKGFLTPAAVISAIPIFSHNAKDFITFYTDKITFTIIIIFTISLILSTWVVNSATIFSTSTPCWWTATICYSNC